MSTNQTTGLVAVGGILMPKTVIVYQPENKDDIKKKVLTYVSKLFDESLCGREDCEKFHIELSYRKIACEKDWGFDALSELDLSPKDAPLGDKSDLTDDWLKRLKEDVAAGVPKKDKP